MRIAMISGSPKEKNSASQVILDFAQNLLPDSAVCAPFKLKDANVRPDVIKAIMQCDILLWAFPLYVDALPSHLLPWLLELERSYLAWEGPQPSVYVCANCGFYEAEQNEIALEIMANWAAKAGLLWGQGVGLGAGGVYASLRNVPLGKWPLKDLKTVLEALTGNLAARKSGVNLFACPNFPRFSYKLVAEAGWRRSALRNGLSLKDLHRKIEWERPS